MKLTLQTLTLIISLILFTACGSGNSSNTTQSDAIDRIEAFASSGTPVPSIQDYMDAGVVGITEANLADINEIVSNLTPAEVDTKEKIQTLANNAGVTLSPTAVATASKSTVTEGQQIRFSASSSTDPDGSIVNYEWKEGNKVLFTISVFDITTLSVGKHTLTLTVTDNNGNSNSASVSVTVTSKAVVTTTSSGNTNITHNGTTYGLITSPHTGKVWLDRNLGANRVCTSFNDASCYGDYYQWGREFDGHQDSGSSTVTMQAANIISAGISFIKVAANDWIVNTFDPSGTIRKNNWLKTDGSSVCPLGYKVATSQELSDETIAQGVTNATTAFNNFLKIPSAGARGGSSATVTGATTNFFYWTSETTVIGLAKTILSTNTGVIQSNSAYANGYSVRCIKN